ncbi:MAG: Ig-like domain-containing protein [Fuerstiella sp.]
MRSRNRRFASICELAMELRRRGRRSLRRRRSQNQSEALESRCLLTAELVSVSPSPGPFEAGSDYSTNPDLSADGRYVVFQSHADNLVDDVADTNGTQDIFVRDLATGRTTLISVNFAGTDSARSMGLSETGASITSGSFYPAISDSGRFVAFVSHAKDLVKDVDIDVTPNVYVRDRDADEDGVFDEAGSGETSTMLLSMATDGTAAGIIGGSGAATRPVISGNGTWVAFASFAPDIPLSGVTDVNGSGGDVFRANTDTGVIELVSVAGDGVSSGSSASSTVADLSISGSGGVVAFQTTHSDLTSVATGGAADTNARPDIFIGSGNSAVELITINAAGTGTADEGSREPSVSANGRHVAFFSSATDLVGGVTDTNGTEDVFVRDLKTGRTTLVSRSLAGGIGAGLTTGDGPSPGGALTESEITAGPAMSADGRFVVFKSSAGDLLDPALGVVDDNTVADIFVFDRDPDGDGAFDEPGETETILVSVNSEGTASTGHTVPLGTSFAPSISSNGRFVAFASTGTDLVPGVSGLNIYVRDLVMGITSLVSETSTGAGGGPDGTTPPTRMVTISDNGAIVGFQSETDAGSLDASVTDPVGGSPVPFGELDVFAGRPTGDIVVGRNFATGTTEFSQSFRIVFDDVAPFDLGYFLSDDALFDPGTDTPLGTMTVSDPDDLTVDGNRFVVATLGTTAGETALPGIGEADADEDYFILTVADPAAAVTEFDGDPFNEDNTRPLRGLYHIAGGPNPVFVHGAGRAETISATVTGDTLVVDYGLTGFAIPGSFAYPVADVSEVRIRTHDGDDTVTGSDLIEVIFGGAGSDLLEGGGAADRLFGGPGKDRLLGGDGDDLLDGGDGPDTLIGGPGADTFFDGPGDDIVDAGPEDDVVMYTPGSDDIFIDGGGLDTIDLSLDDLEITLDLDSTAVQSVDADGNTVRLEGVWENFVGSPFGNTLTVRPLPGTPRVLTGGIGTDLLIVNAGGNLVIDDGTKLSFPGSGLGDILYSGFEQRRVIDAAARVIDDGDAGYSAPGFTRIFDPVFPQGLNGDVEFSGPNSGDTATWTFTEIPSGIYAVSATWTSAPDRATNTRFRIFDGTTGGIQVSEQRVNQQLAPQEFTDSGVGWSNLDIVTISGTQLTVELDTAGADGFVLADAVRLVPLQHAPPFGSDPLFFDDASGHSPAVVGTPTVREATGPGLLSLIGSVATFQADLGGVNNGNATGSQASGFRSVAWDDVDATHAAPNSLPQDYFNSTLTRGLQLFTAGTGFQVSGSAASAEGARFDHLNSTYDTAFSTFSPERLLTSFSDPVFDVTFFVPGTDTPAAVSGFGAVFTDVDKSFTSQLQFFDAAGEQIFQRFVPATAGDGSQSFVGAGFDDPVIARVRITAGEGSLLSSGSPNDFTQGGPDDLVVLDDFIFGEPVALPTPVPGDKFSSHGSAIRGPGFLSDQHTLWNGQSASWTLSDIPAGTYVVSTTWTSGRTYSNAAPFSISNGVDDRQGTIDQQLPPDDFADAGLWWERLAKIEIDEGQVLEVDLTSPSGSTVIADAIRLDPAPTLVVSRTEDPGFIFNPEDEYVLGSGSGSIRISNIGSGPLFAGPVSVSPNFFPEYKDAVWVRPGQFTDLQIDFTATDVGTYDGTLTFDTNDFDVGEFVLNLSATIPVDNTPPVVEIVSPDNGASFIEGTAVPIRIDASDDVSVQSVDLLDARGIELESDTSAPFEFQYTPPSDTSSFVIRVTARDAAGNSADADPITVELVPDEPPTVTISTPPDGQGVIAGDTVRVGVEAEDDVGIQRVEFLVDDVVNHVLSLEPFVVDIPIADPGEKEIRVVAFDSLGNSASDTVHVTAFPPPEFKLPDIVLGPTDSNVPPVRLFEPTGTETFRFLPYDSFLGGVRVAVGDISGDGTPDIITGAGPGGRPVVKVFDGNTGAQLRSFFAFDPSFRGGIFVGAGDLNGDSFSDIIVGADAGGGPRVRVFSGADHSELFNFFAYDTSFTGGVRVAAGDVTGDGIPDIITGAGPGGGPHVRVFDGSTPQPGGGAGIDIGGQSGNFFAYDPGFTGGVFVGAADVNRDGFDDVVTGPGVGHAPVVKLFNGQSGTLMQGFHAFDPGFTGGVTVAGGDVNSDGRDDIVTGAAIVAEPPVRLFDVPGNDDPPQLLEEFQPVGFTGGVFVAGSSPFARSFSVSQTDQRTAVTESGDTDQVDVVLNAKPQTDVVLTVSASDATQLSADRVRLTFTPLNWNQKQSVAISGVNDGSADGDQHVSLTISVDQPGSDTAFGQISDIVIPVIVLDTDPGRPRGDIDGDVDFDANDSFLTHLMKLAGTDQQIDQSKGSSLRTVTEIRSGIDLLQTAGDVDGDGDFDANDSFLIHLVKLAGTDVQIDQSKGSSPLTAAEIRARVNALAGGSEIRLAEQQAAVTSPLVADSASQRGEPAVMLPLTSQPAKRKQLFPEQPPEQPEQQREQFTDDISPATSTRLWDEYREWIDTI